MVTRMPLILAMLALLVPSLFSAAEGMPIIEHFSGAETGNHGTIFSVAQDEDGVMYFGGLSLLTYDGERWRSFPMGNSYAVRRLMFGADGRLWAGGMNEFGWFELNGAKGWEYHSLIHHVPPTDRNFQDVFWVFPSDDATVFVTTDRVFRWDGKTLQAWHKPTANKLYAVQSPEGWLIHHLETGFYRVARSGLERVLPADAVPPGNAALWAERRAADWLLVASEGIFLNAEGHRESFAPEIEGFLQRGRLSCATRHPDGRFILGTVNSGLAVLAPDGRVQRIIGEREGLSSPNITSVFVARDGGLWATTWSHVIRLNLDSPTTIFGTSEGVPARDIIGVTRARDRLVFSNGGSAYALDTASGSFDRVPGFDVQHHRIVSTDRGLVGAMFKHARLWDGEATHTIYEGSGSLLAAAQSPVSRELFIAGARQVVGVGDTGPRVVIDDLPATLTSLAPLENGEIWAGSYSGGVLLSNWQTRASAAPPPSHTGLPPLLGVTVVRRRIDDALLVAASNGLWVRRREDAQFAEVRHAPTRKFASVSEASADGTWWILYEKTPFEPALVGRISEDKRGFVWEPHSVEGLTAAGPPRSIFAEVDAEAGTVLWIGGTRGLLRHRVGSSLHAPAPKAPLVRALLREPNNTLVSFTGAQVPHSFAGIRVEFAAPEFRLRPLLRIQTRVEGIDDTWVTLSAASVREFDSLRDGHYTLHARVVAETGAFSPITELHFEILPPWWRTRPAIAGAASLLLLLGFAAYRLRLRTLRRHNEELEEKVRLRTEELRAANAAKTQFVANMSHDIRNPLNGIVGLALALEDTRLDRRQRDIVATLRECTTYLSTLVDDVLDFASIEAGRVELRPVAFAPAQLLESIVTTLKADTAESGATLVCEIDPALPPHLLADPGRVQQILVNFVSNALKYAGGSIRLTASIPPGGPDEVEFAVVDVGPGISPSDQATLFTKFTRLQSSRDAEIPGAGLGLAACRLLADIMGGSVGVQSTPGQGARFFLRLPLTVATSNTTPDITHLPNTTVLLVEDADYNAMAATAVLSRLGLSCDRAHTGEEAIRMFGERHYNVVLLDRNLPDMDGTEVARRIRGLETEGPQSVILAVTAYCTAEDRALCLAAGMDAFVGKPLTPDKLRRTLLAAGRKLLAAATVDVSRDVPLPETTPAELDLSLLAYLSEGGEVGFSQQVDRFLEALARDHTQLISAMEAGDLASVGAHAHRLLGQARMIGNRTLAASALELEKAAGAADTEMCQQRLARVSVEIAFVTEAMRRRPQSTPTA